jgi:carbon monoxide dehydrogenase subunit G
VQLEHSFTVPAPIDEAWKVLLDIERVAPCMPGAAITSVEGDDFTGTVKVKLGPIGLTYKGKASFVEKDEATHRTVINAQGRDSRGNGTAAAKVTATLTDDGGSATKVHVLTDLDITGKPAQFGRGVMVDVGNKLIGQFADCLAGKLGGGDEPDVETLETESVYAAAAATAPAPPESTDDGSAAQAPDAAQAAPAAEVQAAPVTSAPATSTPTTAARSAPAQADVEPINLLDSAGPAVAKRIAPLAGGLVLVLVVLRVLTRRRARKHARFAPAVIFASPAAARIAALEGAKRVRNKRLSG